MHDYVINPWFIYFYELYGKLEVTIKCMCYISFIVTLLFIILIFLMDCKRHFIISFIISIILFLIILFFPSRNTLLVMYACKYFTQSKLEQIYNESKQMGKNFKEASLEYLKDVIRIINEEFNKEKK